MRILRIVLPPLAGTKFPLFMEALLEALLCNRTPLNILHCPEIASWGRPWLSRLYASARSLKHSDTKLEPQVRKVGSASESLQGLERAFGEHLACKGMQGASGKFNNTLRSQVGWDKLQAVEISGYSAAWRSRL